MKINRNTYVAGYELAPAPIEGIGWVATAHHGAMKHVMPVRQDLGFRTVFNLLGPLSNPAGATRQVLGVFDAKPPFSVLRAIDTGPITNHVNFARINKQIFAYVTVGGLNVVKVFRTSDGNQVATIPVGKLPHAAGQ